MHVFVDLIESDTCSLSFDVTPGYTYFKAECNDIDTLYKLDIDYTSVMHDILKMLNLKRASNGSTIFKYAHIKSSYKGVIEIDGEVLDVCAIATKDILYDIISSAFTRQILEYNRSVYKTVPRGAYKHHFVEYNPILEIKKVIFNKPATIVLWSDGTKTVVKCGKGDIFDPEKGLAMCFVKKLLGNTGKYYEVFKKHCDSYQPQSFTASELEDLVSTRPWFLTTKPHKN